MTKGEAFEKFGDRIKKAELALAFAYQRYYKERDEAEKELQKVLGEINAAVDTSMRHKVMCSYCQRIVMVDKSVIDSLDETTAFCCPECAVKSLKEGK